MPNRGQLEKEMIESGMANEKDLRDLLILTIDGSGTSVFVLNSTFKQQEAFCVWKHEHQLRWFVVISPMGRISYVSSIYRGKYDDVRAMNSDFCDFYKV